VLVRPFKEDIKEGYVINGTLVVGVMSSGREGRALGHLVLNFRRSQPWEDEESPQISFKSLGSGELCMGEW
jgi:hypothetical protein